MKRFAAALLCAASFLPATTLAQQAPAPATSPAAVDPHVLDDLGMHLTVSNDYTLVGRRAVDPTTLSDQLATVAVWVHTKEPHTRITVSEEGSDADTAGFEVTFENELRGAIDGAVIRNKKDIRLSNGFPAVQEEIVAGEGFNTQKIYAFVWADGLRGIAIQVEGRLGEIDEKTATSAFTEMRAVVFPKYRLQQPPR